VLLRKLGAGPDIPIGTPIAERTDEALEDLVGLFLNTLVVRTDTAGDPAFAELLGRVRETDLAADAHQDVPFEQLVEVVNPERSAARHPLVQTMVTLPSDGAGEVTLPGVEVSAVPVPQEGAKSDLSFAFAETRADGAPAGIEDGVEFATDLFDRRAVRSLLARYVRVLEQVTDDPSRTLAQIDVVTGEECTALLIDYNNVGRTNTTTDGPPIADTAVHELFEGHAARTPGAVAIEPDGTELTYGEVNAAANRLARHLRTEGCRAGALRRAAAAADAGVADRDAGGAQVRCRVRPDRSGVSRSPDPAGAGHRAGRRQSRDVPVGAIEQRVRAPRVGTHDVSSADVVRVQQRFVLRPAPGDRRFWSRLRSEGQGDPVVPDDVPAGGRGFQQGRGNQQGADDDVPAEEPVEVEQGGQFDEEQGEQEDAGPCGRSCVACRTAVAGENRVGAALTASGLGERAGRPLR
jgi:hypothetical protein